MKRIAKFPLAMVAALLSLTLLATGGCDSTHAPEATAPSTEDVGSGDEAIAPSAVTAADVALVDKAGFDAFLAENKGKVVFVDYWATWCGNCKEMFPHTVELQKKYGKDGLVVVAASVDEPSEENKQAVAEFLSSQGGDLEAFILTGDEDVMDAFGIEIAVPHYQLFDAEGQLTKKFVFGDPTSPSPKPEEIDAAVGELLTQTNSAEN